jgi:phospholipid transport system substrate-binding protein
MISTASVQYFPGAYRRLLAPFAAFMLAMVIGVSGVSAATPAETFVQNNVQKGLTILNNKSAPKEQVINEFRDFLLSLTDLNRIAMFTLGPAKRTASEADKKLFATAFAEYATAIYQSRLTQYSGQTLKVIGSQERAKGDYIVRTVMANPDGSTSGDPIRVDFRVLNDNGHFVVIDVSVVGVWLAIEQRDLFTAFVGQHKNSVPALT